MTSADGLLRTYEQAVSYYKFAVINYIGFHDRGMLLVRRARRWEKEYNKSEFVERFPELSLFFKAYSLLDSEMICIFPYLCPYAESAREIREIFS